MFDRRQFLVVAGSGMLTLAAKESKAEDPFDSLSANVLRNARHNGLCMIRHPTPSAIASHAQITAVDEPGRPLLVAGQVFAPDGQKAAPHVTVYAYNTDANGHYGENHTALPPRIYGWMKTDDAGRFSLRTILPGRYPGMQVPAHIHFTLWGAGYPLQWVDDLRFEGDSYLTPAMRSESEQLADFCTIQPLSESADGCLRCTFKIRLQQQMNFS